MVARNVFLFPGQGGYLQSVFTELGRNRVEVADVFAEIDAAITGCGCSPVSAELFESPPSLDALLESGIDTLQFALYGTGVALHRVLVNAGVRPTVLVGHSIGEIAALTAAGAFSVGDGAVIVANRTRALRSAGVHGGMLALGAGVRRISALLELMDLPGLAVAVTNSPRQVAISGPEDGLDTAAELARRVGIPVMPVRSPYPFHNSLLGEAALDFERGIRDVRQLPLRRQVYSPILNRYYTDADDLGVLLAGHLTRPVDFLGAMQYLYSTGFETFIECGARGALAKIVRNSLPQVRVFATVVSGVAATESVAQVIGRLAQTPTGQAAAELESSPPEPVPGATAHPGGTGRGPDPATAAAKAGLDRDEVSAELGRMYAEAVEYPVEVFGPDVELEADLGIDSVRQTELMARVAERYGLPPVTDDFRITDYGTLGRIADFVVARGSDTRIPA